MSTEKKTISINPDLFQVGGKTKKSKPKQENQSNVPEIKMKTLTPAKNNTLKRQILKIIRAKQQDEYKRLFTKTASDKKMSEENVRDTFNADLKTDAHNGKDKEFTNSLNFLTDLEKKVNQESHNQTFKKMPAFTNEPVVFNELPPEFNLQMPTEIMSYGQPAVEPVPLAQKYVVPPHPGYGCLKGGTIPTYRTIKNKNGIMHVPVYQPPANPVVTSGSGNSYSGPSFTQQRPASAFAHMPTGSLLQSGDTAPKPNVYSHLTSASAPITHSAPSSQMQPQSQSDNKNAFILADAKKQYSDKMHTGNYNKIKNMKRRKIYKRTYRVGKSKVAPKIGCLISNKTIRQKIQQSVYDLKHANMKDIRKFLLKRGFIKVGTTAPNDVLRKMYESVATVCGEVQNHNSDNLLYNFVNDKNNDNE